MAACTLLELVLTSAPNFYKQIKKVRLNMSLDKETVKNIANLARINVPDENLDHLANELSFIMDWVNQLNSVNTDGVEPLASVIDVTLPLREDKVTDGDCRNKILANGPEIEDGYFAVPKVIE